MQKNYINPNFTERFDFLEIVLIVRANCYIAT